MQNVPNIVRERLKRTATSSSHPDANVLTAFAEHSLPEAERALVLDHLARCGDCREIIAVALPASESAQRVVQPAPRSWLAWPVLRWGSVAAGIVAIASVGIVYYRRPAEQFSMRSDAHLSVPTQEPKIATPDSAIKDKASAEAAPRPAPSVSSEATDRQLGEAGKKTVSKLVAPAPAAPSREAVHGSAHPYNSSQFPHGPKLADAWQQNYAQNQNQAVPAANSPFAKQQVAGDLAANVKIPAQTEKVAVEAQSAQLEAKDQGIAAGGSLPPQPAQQDEMRARVDRAKPAAAEAGSGASSVPAAPAPVGDLLASSTTSILWNISASGLLQRSFDHGATWQPIDVNANPPAASLQVSATSRAKVRKMASPVFRTLAMNGSDIWAGGSAGALYHSLDAGNHWRRISPAADGIILTGDILSLQFPDSEHGRLATSTSEIWTTQDSGQTWKKQ